MAFPLTQEQRNIVADRGGELLVSAAAGSGKTRVLVERLLDRVTEEEIDIDRFLVITYTKAAAAELRERIAQELTDRLAQNPGDWHLRRQTTLVYQAQISTIHSFCSALLRENGYLLDIDPDFRLCDEIEGEVLMRQTLESVIDGHYSGLAPDSPFAQLADTLGAGRDDTRLVEIVLDIVGRVQSHADPQKWLLDQRELWSLKGIEDLTQTAWGTLLLDDARRQAARCLEMLSGCLEAVDGDELLSQNYGASLRDTLSGIKGLVQAESWDEAAGSLPIPFPRVGTKRKRKQEVSLWEEMEAARAAERIKALRERCKKAMDKVAEQFSGDSCQLLEELRLSSDSMHALIDLVLEFQDAFAAEKKRRSLMDFSDLEHFAVKLLCDEKGMPTSLAQEWSLRYDEVLVDEYQDTNQVQNAIFAAISDSGRKLVQVGDVKQSIYRFRLADPTIFLEKYRRFVPGDEAEEGQSRVRLLSRNFRSRPQVLEGCNDLFRAVMSTRLGEMEYTDDQALIPGASFPEGDNYSLELNILDLNRDEEEPDGTNRPGRDLLEARFTARRIREMLDKPFLVSEGEELRPVRPSDIMVLLRSPGSVLHQYIRAFGEVGIPWSAESGGDYFETPEIYAALSILQIVDNPRQDVPLIAALRSPVYGFTADQLAFLRGQSKGDFYDALTKAAQEGHQASVDFLVQLEQMRFGAGDMTTSQLIWHIYEKTNLLGIFGAMEHGEQRQENLLSLYSLAQQMEGSGCSTLFQFLLRLERLKQTGGKVKTAASGMEGEGISIMSIHRSKGLEKPVVFLCGLTKQMNKVDLTRPVLFHPTLGIGPKGLDRERRVEYSTVARRAVSRQLEREMYSEELRLLYVAMTRAREKLVMNLALKDGRKTISDMTDLLARKIAPELLEQQPTVGHWVLLHALSREEAGEVDEIRTLGERRASFVFGPAWDIRWHRGEDYVHVSRPAADKDDHGERIDAEVLARQLHKISWKYPTPAPANIPSKLTATQLKGRAMDSEISENATQQNSERSQPICRPNFIVEEQGLTPAQRGTALHLVMEKLPLDGDLSEGGIRLELERMVTEDFLTAAQRDVIPVKQIAAFYKSELGQRLTRAKTCQREFKFSLLVDAEEYFPEAVDEELLLQGVVDLWFEDEDGITVVDFKSDYIQHGEEQAKAEEYRPQLKAYAKALRAVLGTEKLHTVLWFFKTATAVEL